MPSNNIQLNMPNKSELIAPSFYHGTNALYLCIITSKLIAPSFYHGTNVVSILRILSPESSVYMFQNMSQLYFNMISYIMVACNLHDDTFMYHYTQLFQLNYQASGRRNLMPHINFNATFIHYQESHVRILVQSCSFLF